MTSIITDKTITQAIISIAAIIILFSAFWYSADRQLLQMLLKKLKYPPLSGPALEFTSEKLTGILMTGVLPLILFVFVLKQPVSGTAAPVSGSGKTGYLVYLIPLLTAVISFFSSRNKELWKYSPRLRETVWNTGHVFLSSGLWIAYLLGYEFLFRGILWFACYEAFGFQAALIVNLILYSLVHLPQGTFMTLGAIPLGVLLCCMSFLTGSFLPAFLTHACMAVTTELSSFYHNPEFRFSRTGH